MPISQRAKQFAPFAALKGFEEALKKKERLFIEKPVFSEEMAEKLNHELTKLKKEQKLTVEYFCDGELINITNYVKCIDTYNNLLVLESVCIPISDIIKINVLS